MAREFRLTFLGAPPGPGRQDFLDDQTGLSWTTGGDEPPTVHVVDEATKNRLSTPPVDGDGYPVWQSEASVLHWQIEEVSATRRPAPVDEDAKKEEE